LLRNRRFAGFKSRRQHPIGDYFADFVCLDKRIVIELDGSQHAEQADRDAERTRVLERAGFRVLRFWDNDVLMRPQAVLEKIFEELGCPSP
jgi:very-short-patch-repair endonuclease